MHDDLIYGQAVEKTLPQGRVNYFIQSKFGHTEKASQQCEDGLFFNPHYLLLCDGSTDKSGREYAGKKSGRVARDIILSVFQHLAADADKEQILTEIYRAYQEFYQQYQEIDFQHNPILRPTATLIWYSFARNELVGIGDVKARIDGKIYHQQEKLVDKLNALMRVQVIKTLGLTAEQLSQNDLGREYILPLLKRQSEFQNNPQAPVPFQFWLMDGFPIPADKFFVWQFESPPQLIELSSDGYADLPAQATIAAYEQALKDLLSTDPMRVHYPSTKGLMSGNSSFDDRSVLIFSKSKEQA